MKDNNNLEGYFDATKTSPPSETAMCTIKELGEKKGLVIDLGCGAVTRRKEPNISLLPYTKERVHEFYKQYVPDAMIFSKDEDIRPYLYREDKVERYYETKVLDPTRRYFAICLEGKMIGEIQLKYIDFEKQCGTLSIILSNDTVKGYGFGTRAEELILNYAFNDLRLSTVYADAVIRNTRSQHVLETLGFVYTHEDEMLRYYEIHKDDLLSRSDT